MPRYLSGRFIVTGVSHIISAPIFSSQIDGQSRKACSHTWETQREECEQGPGVLPQHNGQVSILNTGTKLVLGNIYEFAIAGILVAIEDHQSKFGLFF